MKNLVNIAILSILCLIISINTSAQSKRKTLNLANDFVENEDFSSAINMYNKLIEQDPNNGILYFKLGYCYLNTPQERDKANSCFQKADQLFTKKEKKSIEGKQNSFFIAKSYRAKEEFDSALTVLYDLKKKVSDKELKEAIEKEIEYNITSKELKANGYQVTVNIMSDAINGEHHDHSPILTLDESQIFFTSRRPVADSSEALPDGDYVENVYVASCPERSEVFEKAVLINEVNTYDEHDATASVSYDGTELIIYRPEDEGTFYISKFDGEKWGEPEKMSDNINTPSRETGGCLTLDGSKFYFASDRKGGYGGMDIWVSERQSDGSWGEAKNLGKTINTSEDEDGPFVMPDYSRLYFSSKGHKGMGDFDIFYSMRDTVTQEWKEPQNMGYPINTIGNEVFVHIAPSGEKMYFTSERPEGQGKSDIYVMDLPSEVFGTDLSVVVAYTKVCGMDKRPESVAEIKDLTTGIATNIRPNIKTGKFVFICHRDIDYSITVKRGEDIVFQDNLNLPQGTPGKIYYSKDIQLDPENSCEPVAQDTLIAAVVPTDEDKPKKYYEDNQEYDRLFEIEDINFPFAKSTMENKPDLTVLADYLKEFPDAIVQIVAYADSKGAATFNRNLTRQRALTVYNYLRTKGVNYKQIKYDGFGEENPVSLNLKQGNYFEESMKYNRRVEFRMLKQGAETILIRPIRSIPDEYKNPDYKRNYEKAAQAQECKF